MLAREGVEHLRAELHRPATAQAVVQKALAAVGVEGRVGSSGIGPVSQLTGKLLGPGEPFCEPIRAEVRREEGVEAPVALRVADEREDAGTLARLQPPRQTREEAGESVLHSLHGAGKLRRALFEKSERPSERRIAAEHCLGVRDGGQPNAPVIDGEGESAAGNGGNTGAVLHADPDAIARGAAVQPLRLHPCPAGLHHVLEHPVADTIGHQRRHAVEQLGPGRSIRPVRQLQPAHERADGSVRQGKVAGLRLKAVVEAGNAQAVQPKVHVHMLRIRRKQLKDLSVQLHKAAEAPRLCQLIRAVGRRELHYRVVLVAGPKACDALAPVHKEAPRRRAVQPRYPGEEVGKRGFFVVVVYYRGEAAVHLISPLKIPPAGARCQARLPP